MKQTKLSRYASLLNHYSLLVHALISCGLIFLIEWISRRSFLSAKNFVSTHTLAFLYNAFLIFCSLTLVYVFRRRAFVRILISALWLILGIINGCVLSNRVTPFGYTDFKCISDLLSMTNTSYFTAVQAAIVVIGFAVFLAFCVVFFIKGPKYTGKIHWITVPAAILALLFVAVPSITSFAQELRVVESYYANIAQGYEQCGFVYSFSSSVVDRGMKKPENYSEEKINSIGHLVASSKKTTSVKAEDAPNIICVLLESFVDPDDIRFLKVNRDPVPTFHELEKKYSSGHLTVPVVGAGTSNSEFEVLTGMSMQYFGTGEYPHKTTLKQVDQCESIASDLSAIGYGTHVVHNNAGNFYSRVNAFAKMGFDTFTSQEMMDITEYTPRGNWASDDILVSETIKAMDATSGQSDFVYTITVSSHGDYPTEPVITNPQFVTTSTKDATTGGKNVAFGTKDATTGTEELATGAKDEAATNQWNYYVNQLNAVDRFMKELIDAVAKRKEKTVIVFFGDHLPTMGLMDSDMASNSIYKTKYVTWNNMGLEKADQDLYAYQLLAHVMDSVGIHEGTLFNYHQTQDSSASYYNGLENLQYDLLYGKKYSYHNQDLYPSTTLIMGVEDVVIDSMEKSINQSTGQTFLYLHGRNFTKWSQVYVDQEKVSTTYISGDCLGIALDDVTEGSWIQIKQLGSGGSVFRTSNEVRYSPNSETEPQ